jgi:chromate reductase
MGQHHLLGICGALRKGSTNRLLMEEARRIFDPATFTEGDIRLPLFDEDIETGPGIPEAVQTLHRQIGVADAVLIATPEYNKSIPGGLKNALDWVSRVKGAVWRDKPVAIVSAADGRAGGDRSQFALRLAMVPFRARVLSGPEVMVANSRHAFDDDGRLKEESYTKALADLMGQLHAEIARKGG